MRFRWTAFAVLLTLSGATAPPPRRGVSDASLKHPIASLQPLAIVQSGRGSDWVTIDDSVWVSSKEENSLSRIDPANNKVIATVAVDRPCSGLALAFGSVWVPLCRQKAIARVDEKTDRVVATIPAAVADSEGSITANADGVWLVGDSKRMLRRIDPKTNAPVEEIAVTPGSVAVRYGFGSLWVTSPEKNVVTRVNPSTKTVTGMIATGRQPRFLTVGEGAVWVVNQGDGTVTRIDPVSGKVRATIPCGVNGDGGDITAGGGAVWVTAFTLPLTRIDPSTDKVVSQYLGEGGDSVGYGHGSVWLANFAAGTVWRIKP